MQRRSWIKRIFVFLLVIFMLSQTTFALDELIADATEKLTEIMEKLRPENIINLLTSNLISFSKALCTHFAACLTVILFSSVFGVIKNSFSSGENPFELVSIILAAIVIFAPVASCFEKVQEHIELVCGFMISLIPSCVMLHTASGNALSAALMSTATGSVITLLQMISVSIVLPLTKSLFALSTANTIYKNPHIASITGSIKGICLWTVGLSFTLFTGILTLQSLLQSGADNLTMKGLRYGAAKLIPIAGGMISESMKTVISCVGYIKNVTGIAGITFIIYALLPPICYIILTKVYLAILSSIAKIGGTNYLSGFFDNTNSIINILLAVLLSISVAVIIVLTIFIKSTVSI